MIFMVTTSHFFEMQQVVFTTKNVDGMSNIS